MVRYFTTFPVPEQIIEPGYRGLGGLTLAEEDRRVPLRGGPVVDQLAGDGSDVRTAELAPQLHSSADLVDEVVRLEPVARPFRGQRELRTVLAGGRIGTT